VKNGRLNGEKEARIKYSKVIPSKGGIQIV
jgi:hypothetical protein